MLPNKYILSKNICIAKLILSRLYYSHHSRQLNLRFSKDQLNGESDINNNINIPSLTTRLGSHRFTTTLNIVVPQLGAPLYRLLIRWIWFHAIRMMT